MIDGENNSEMINETIVLHMQNKSIIVVVCMYVQINLFNEFCAIIFF